MMHATIQKPLEEILGYLSEGEHVFVVGCSNCAAKAHSGGEPEVREMVKRLQKHGVHAAGWAVPPDGGSLCKLSTAKQLLNVDHRKGTEAADSFLVLACGQGIHTVIDATDGGEVHPGCDTIFGGETVTDDYITEYCSLCGECIVEYTGGLCPLTLCAKGLLNGPCGGAKDAKCEVNQYTDCGWHLIYERLKSLGKLDVMRRYMPPKDHLRWTNPRSLRQRGTEANFRFAGTGVSISSRLQESTTGCPEGSER